MSEQDLVLQSLAKILERHCAPAVVAASRSSWSEPLWKAIEEAGIPLVSLPESFGGIGGTWPEIAGVVRLAARHAAPVPVAEALLATRFAVTSGLTLPEGAATLAVPRADEKVTLKDGSLSGSVARVPWARVATSIVTVAERDGRTCVVVVPVSAVQLTKGLNLAREPRDDVRFDGVRVADDAVAESKLDRDRAYLLAAMLRAAQMTGALDAALDLTVSYAQVRVQFGSPIAKFQAIQQELALFAGEAAAARAAVDATVAAKSPTPAAIAAAKIRAGAAAGAGARVAHQVHGAIGITQEHQLHHLTTRLWSWRDEFGGEREWAIRLGRFALEQGRDGLWAWLTRSAEEAAK